MVNTVYLMGNLADDPQVDVYEQREESRTQTKFVLISGPNKGQVAKIAVVTADFVAKVTAGLRKGQQVLVIGELQTYRWDEGNGTKEKTSVNAHQVYPIAKPKQ